MDNFMCFFIIGKAYGLMPCSGSARHHFIQREEYTSHPAWSRPWAAPVKYASLRLRLFHWAGRASQEEEMYTIHIHRAGVYE